MYYVPDGTKQCGYYECKECGNRFLDLRIAPSLVCPYCGEAPDMEIGPDEEMPVIDAQENYLILGLVDVHFITHRFVCAERNFGWRISKIRLVYMYEADYVIRRY